jgi:hypothetical protein
MLTPTAVALGAALLAPAFGTAPLAAQAATPTGATAPAPLRRVTVSRTMLGDAALVINARSDGRIEIGVAGERTLDLRFPWGPVATWADSAGKVLRGRPRPRRGDTLTWRAELEHSERGGSMALNRRAAGNQSTYSLFFADSAFGGFSVPVTPNEATILVNTMRRAVSQARALASPPKDSTQPPVSKPAPKPASKPATKSTPPPAKKTPASPPSPAR